jgi:hypothetical protein
MYIKLLGLFNSFFVKLENKISWFYNLLSFRFRHTMTSESGFTFYLFVDMPQRLGCSYKIKDQEREFYVTVANDCGFHAIFCICQCLKFEV